MFKKIKKWHYQYSKLLVMILLLGLGGVKSLATCDTTLISGSTPILPGDTKTYVLQYSGATNVTWSKTASPPSGSDITLTSNSSLPTFCNVTVSSSSSRTTCHIMLRVDYRDRDSNAQCATKDIYVLPRIDDANSPSCIFPGEEVEIPLTNTCATSLYQYSWSTSPPAACGSPCTATNSSLKFTLPGTVNPLPSNIIISCSVNNGNLGIINVPLTPYSIGVCLRPPSKINGPITIGCPNSTSTGSLQYSVPSVTGATSYIWTVDPNFFQILSGQGTQTITVNAIATTASNNPPVPTTISVVSNSGSVTSDTTRINVVICCLSSLSVTTNVLSSNTDKQQSGVLLNASNIINNGASAMYHAGSEVKLSAGFTALNSCYFHAYIAQCDSTWANFYKGAVIEPEQSEVESLPTTKEISIYPNPSNSGIFTVKINCKDKGNIEVYTILGNKIYRQDMKAKTSEHTIDISQYAKGMYIARILVDNEAYTQKIIIE